MTDISGPVRLKNTTRGGSVRWLGLRDGAWAHLREQVAAFVFPTSLLARRYAQWINKTTGEDWEVESAANEIPHTTSNLGSTCRSCGCTDAFACPGRCHWHSKELCSECATAAKFAA